MQSLLNDLRYALRQLRKSPVFALTAIATLALGIGANTAIFSLLDQALLRSLPVHDPQQLVVLEGTGKMWEGHASSWGGDEEAYFSYPMYKDLRDRNQVFQGLIAINPASVEFTRGNDAQIVDAELVSGNYFTLLGVQPALGQVFTQSDDARKDGNPVAVLSFDFWKDHLGSNPSVVGASVAINGHPFQIIGVSAPGFRSAVWGQKPGLFVPMAMLGQVWPGKDSRLTNHKDKWMNIVGRLKPGVTRSQAEVAMNPLWHALRADELKALGTQSKHFTDDFLTNSRMRILPGARGFSYDRENYETPLFAVMAMAALVLLIAVVNVASLLLVRSANRVREFSLRFALGAQSKRIFQQLLLEGLLIGFAGGAAGMLVAISAIRALVHQLGGRDASADFVSTIDSRLLIFNFVIALVVSIFFSLAPILQLRRPNLSAVLGQRSMTGPGSVISFRRVVVCLQIGLSVVLLVGAGLFVRTMQKLRTADVGFTTTHLLGFGINPKLAGYSTDSVAAIHRNVLDTIAALPGIQTAAATTNAELVHQDHGGNITLSGYTAGPDEDMDVEKYWVSEGYYSTLQVPLLAGRGFTESDAPGHPLVAVVNAAFAKKYCGTVNSCLGRMVGDGGGDKVKLNIQIVGIARDIRHSGIRDAALTTIFFPMRQQTDPASMFFYMRTYSDPAHAISMVRQTMKQSYPRIAVDQLGTMDAQIDDDLSNDNLVMLLAIAFGLLAALLSGVGIYGVLAFSTAQRTREIGIRIAVGSSRPAIARIILADVLTLGGISIAVALPVTFGLSYLVRSQLFGVSPADPLSLATAVLLVAVVALIAALIPAIRAAGVNPTEALRSE